MRFSVLVAAYNASATLRATLDSIAAQTEMDWQACVVDDGSSDDTYEIAAEYAARDARFTVAHQANRGSGAARNAAAGVASGEWLCILDADDMYRPGYLEHMKAFILAHPGFDVYSCNADALLPDGSTRPYGPERYPRGVCSQSLVDTIGLNRIFVAAVVRADVFRRAGGFRDDVYVEDYDLWLRLLNSGSRHIQNPESLVVYRISAYQKTSNVEARSTSMIEVYRHLLGSGVDRASARALRVRIREESARLRRFRADAAWAELRGRLLDSEYSGARHAYWDSRGGSLAPVRYCAGLVLVTLSPRFLAASLKRRKRRVRQARRP